MPDFWAKMHQKSISVGWGSAPDPAVGAYSAPPDPLAGFEGPTSKGRGGEGRGGRLIFQTFRPWATRMKTRSKTSASARRIPATRWRQLKLCATPPRPRFSRATYPSLLYASVYSTEVVENDVPDRPPNLISASSGLDLWHPDPRGRSSHALASGPTRANLHWKRFSGF